MTHHRTDLLVIVANLLLLEMTCLVVSATPEARPTFKSLRYDEDYRFLADSALKTDLWDGVKYVPIAGGSAGFFSFGGEARERFEVYENEFFSTNPHADNAYFLQRYLLHADFHPTEWLRVFGQLQSSFEDGRSDGPRPTDHDTMDFHQLFVDTGVNTGDGGRLTLRAGRQEMAYGSERLISTREGLNNRRAFDAVRVLYQQSSVKVDAFVASPVEVDEGAFDDQRIRDVCLWGSYVTVPFPPLPGMELDFYYLGFHNPRAGYSQSDGSEERHTIGTRFFGKLGHWDLNHEALYQFGRFASGNIDAWSVATDHGYTWENFSSKPRLGLKAAVASGDRNANNADLQTLNPLFPRGNYFTEASLLGPQNFFDVHPSLQFRPFPKWKFEMGADFYWRASLEDGIYTPGGSVIYRGNASYARFVGTDFSLNISWQATRHISVSAAYTHFFAGKFIRQSGGDDVDYGAVWTTYKF